MPKREKCPECGKPIFLIGIRGNRPVFACGCGPAMVGNSSYNGCVAWSLDPDEILTPTPKLRLITGEDLAWGNWQLAKQEIEELMQTYPQYKDEFE